MSFPRTLRSSKTDIGSYVNCARENWRKLGKCAGNLTRFSSWTAAFACRVLPARYELIHKFETLRKTATPAMTCSSRFANNISRLAGIFAEKTQKNSSDASTSGSHNLFFFKLRFAQNWYRWKVDFSSFPTVPRMTHFGHQKAPKSSLEKAGKKLYRYANRRGFARGATWQIRLPRVTQHHHAWATL